MDMYARHAYFFEDHTTAVSDEIFERDFPIVPFPDGKIRSDVDTVFHQNMLPDFSSIIAITGFWKHEIPMTNDFLGECRNLMNRAIPSKTRNSDVFISPKHPSMYMILKEIILASLLGIYDYQRIFQRPRCMLSPYSFRYIIPLYTAL